MADLSGLETGFADAGVPSITPPPPPAAPTPQAEDVPTQAAPTFIGTIPGLGRIAIPVRGVSQTQISNNFGFPRRDPDGGARSHAGIDLGFGLPEGAEVLAPVDGWIRYRELRPGGYGVAVTVVDQFGNWHQLAHLTESTLDLGVITEQDGLAAPTYVKAGDLVGFMGTTGNARGTEPHLHYAINESRSGTHNLVNPFELLVNGVMSESMSVDPGHEEEGAVSDEVQRDSSEVDDLKVRDVDGNGIPDLEEEMLGKQHLTPETKTEIQERFGHYAAFLDDPEWGPIIITATIQEWSQAAFANAIEQTNRWRTTTATQRAWDALNIQDPGQANAERQAAQNHISDYARRMGIALTNDQLTVLTEDAKRFGWITPQGSFSPALIDGIVGLSRQDDGLLGTLDVTANDIHQQAASYLVSLSDDKAFNLSRRIATGELTPEAVRLELQRDAINQNPFFASQLSQGFTMNDLLDSRRQRIAALLERDPDEIDFLGDPKFSRLVQFASEGDGYRPASYSELEDYVRGLPEYQGTQQAEDKAASLGEFLLQKFGAVR